MSREHENRLSRFAPGARLLRSWPLRGGISARMSVLEYELEPGQARQVVVREQAWGTLFERRQNLERELLTLRAVRSFGLPAPAPYGLDLADEEPALLREYIEAEPDLAPADLPAAMREMARVLRQIHSVKADQSSLAFLPRRHDMTAESLATSPAELDATLDEPRIRAALPPFGSWPHANPSALAHGDFWPGNLLWRAGRIARVVDWEETAIADPLFDLAIARLDIVFAFGLEAMNTFTVAYQALADLDYRALPHWDLNAALRPMHNLARWAQSYPAPPISRPDITVDTMRSAHALFVAQALASLQSAGAAP
jgi:aminoglycoside phosphotransferase (APT) family kinase protein